MVWRGKIICKNLKNFFIIHYYYLMAGLDDATVNQINQLFWIVYNLKN